MTVNIKIKIGLTDCADLNRKLGDFHNTSDKINAQPPHVVLSFIKYQKELLVEENKIWHTFGNKF